MNDTHQEVLSTARTVAIDIAVKASNHVLEYWPYQLNGKFNKDLVNEVYEKEGIGNVATLADKESEKMIIAAIRGDALLKEHTIVGEESAAVITGSDYAWYIDPIDGTIPFRNGLPEFGISIGLLYKNLPVLGVIARPALGEYIVALQDHGVHLYSFSHEIILSLSNKEFSKEQKAERLVVGFDTSNENRTEYLAAATSIITDVAYMLSYGSSSSALFRLAMGQLSGYIHAAPFRWDICAAAAIIGEIGGVISTPNGDEIDWNEERPAFVASYSPEIHSQILSLLQKHRA